MYICTRYSYYMYPCTSYNKVQGSTTLYTRSIPGSTLRCMCTHAHTQHRVGLYSLVYTQAKGTAVLKYIVLVLCTMYTVHAVRCVASEMSDDILPPACLHGQLFLDAYGVIPGRCGYFSLSSSICVISHAALRTLRSARRAPHAAATLNIHSPTQD